MKSEVKTITPKDYANDYIGIFQRLLKSVGSFPIVRKVAADILGKAEPAVRDELLNNLEFYKVIGYKEIPTETELYDELAGVFDRIKSIGSEDNHVQINIDTRPQDGEKTSIMRLELVVDPELVRAHRDTLYQCTVEAIIVIHLLHKITGSSGITLTSYLDSMNYLDDDDE